MQTNFESPTSEPSLESQEESSFSPSEYTSSVQEQRSRESNGSEYLKAARAMLEQSFGDEQSRKSWLKVTLNNMQSLFHKTVGGVVDATSRPAMKHLIQEIPDSLPDVLMAVAMITLTYAPEIFQKYRQTKGV